MYKLEVTLLDFYTLLPMLLLAVFGMAVMVIDLFLKPQHRPRLAWLAFVGFIAAGVALVAMIGVRGLAFSGMLVVDLFAQVLGLVAIGAGALTVLISINYIRDRGFGRNEYYALLLFSVGGMVMMAAANNLIIVFIALELLSIPLYVLAGFAQPDRCFGRSGAEILLARRVCLGLLAVWHRVHVWRAGHDRSDADCGEGRPGRRVADVVVRSGAGAGRVGL